MAESKVQPPRPQQLSDVRPPQALPGEGELAPILLKPKTPSDAVPELRPATKVKKTIPEMKRAFFLLGSLVTVLVIGFVVMRFSLLGERAAQAIVAAREISTHNFSFALPFGAETSVSGGTDGSSESSAPPSVGSLIKKANLSDIWTFFVRGGEVLDRFRSTFENYKSLATETSDLFDRMPGIFFEKEPGPLPTLKKIQAQLASLEGNNKELSSALSSVRDALPLDFSEYLVLGASLNRMSDLLKSGISWLEKPHRVVLAFYNSSEMRPAGGFFGSYAEVTLENGTVQDIQVRDVTEADKEFSESIVPPKPLQYIVKNWRAADANWFFDFPQSASQTLAFLGKSDLYKASGTQFDTFIAISPRVLEDILATTGPIELEERKLTLTAENFLREIQNDVVKERAASAEAPKSILGEVVAVIRERLLNLSEQERSDLSGTFVDWIRYKDIQVFSRDPELQSIIRFAGADGMVTSEAPTQNNDYLALVDSTIGGEKTNYVMRRTVSLRAQIEADGRVSHNLTILRKHAGNKETERWYKVPNRNYFRALIPAGSQILGSSGFTERTPSTRSYGSEFALDQTLSAFEATFKNLIAMPAIQTFEESGKMGVAGWNVTEAGKETKVVLDYEYRLPQPVAEGMPYTFVFEKQAGTEGSYNFEIDAPVGYHFKENQLPIYEYKTEDIPGRVTINLTLEKI